MLKMTAALDGNRAAVAEIVFGDPRVPGVSEEGARYQSAVALLDTGANYTCINEKLLIKLGLVETRKHHLVTPSTGALPVESAIYEISLSILMDDKERFVVEKMEVAAMKVDFSDYKVLIGRDILGRGLFVYDGMGSNCTLMLPDRVQ